MASIVLRVLDGADRGRVYENLQTPVSIGREEGNTIRLNDERVSRFHLKLQEDRHKIVLTDLESTNGTKVNGEDVQLRILRFGDLITVGRSVLLFGSREQIAQRLASVRGALPPQTGSFKGLVQPQASQQNVDFDFEINYGAEDVQSALQMLHPPELPEGLSAGQAAQLSELIEYLHQRIRQLISNSEHLHKSGEHGITLDLPKWQNLIDLQARLAHYLRAIGEPNSER